MDAFPLESCAKDTLVLEGDEVFVIVFVATAGGVGWGHGGWVFG